MDQFLFDLNLTLLWLRLEESWEFARSCPKEEEFSQHAPLHKAARHILHFQSVVSAARLDPRGCSRATRELYSVRCFICRATYSVAVEEFHLSSEGIKSRVNEATVCRVNGSVQLPDGQPALCLAGVES